MTCALTNVMHDVSVRDYADDIHQTVPLCAPNPVEARQKLLASNLILDRKLEQGGGFSQNPDKEVCMPVMTGPGAYTATRVLLAKSIAVPGVVAAESLYLGGMEQLTGGSAAEVRRR
eukprot:5874906-Pyramimonas_sp.AAC.1